MCGLLGQHGGTQSAPFDPIKAYPLLKAVACPLIRCLETASFPGRGLPRVPGVSAWTCVCVCCVFL